MNKVSGVIGAAAASALILAGCGSSGPSDDPAESAEHFLAALAEGDVQGMCEVSAFRSEVYTGPVDSEHWTQSECESDMWDDFADHLKKEEYADVEVGEAEIDGDEADIPPENLTGWPEDINYGVKLQLFDGNWYVVDALGT
jgi:outer membrane murein-binding lipoprotein Lpp